MTLEATVFLAFVVAVAVTEKLPDYKTRSHSAKTSAPVYTTEPPKYSYNYGVADDISGANFAASESRDGYKTEGSYKVNLPDGRIQTVKYVDNGDGLVAEVSYEGEAKYPAYKANTANKTAAAHLTLSPVYKPASIPDPVYKPAPIPSYKPAPNPVPVYKPAPNPVPVYKPAPAPAPVPVNEPVPFTTYKPTSAPDTFTVPVYTTAPTPATTYRPAPAPAPYPVPVYEPDTVPVYKPAYTTSIVYKPTVNPAQVYDRFPAYQRARTYKASTLYD